MLRNFKENGVIHAAYKPRTIEELDVAANQLVLALNKIVDNLAPIKSLRIPMKWIDKPWFNAGILQSIKIRNSLYKKAIVTNDSKDCRVCRQARNKVVDMVVISIEEIIDSIEIKQACQEEDMVSEEIRKGLMMAYLQKHQCGFRNLKRAFETVERGMLIWKLRKYGLKKVNRLLINLREMDILKLQKIQNKAMRMILCCSRETPEREMLNALQFMNFM
ncbi:hypothetical protein KPH14_001071 [Odynerus spinipes]|uniref:Uncharacterized protein n=1 Tax=Odynerus spinipes TaxID=1348599 RepID=A0AAD9R8U4_9HYME|nr:hypothetical protein KPH14_001071 [Odynerus spinipes]